MCPSTFNQFIRIFFTQYAGTYVTPFTTQSGNMVSIRCQSQWMSPYIVASQLLQSQRSYSLQITPLLSLFSITSDIQMPPLLWQKANKN